MAEEDSSCTGLSDMQEWTCMRSGTSLLLDDDCDAELESLLSEGDSLTLTMHVERYYWIKLPKNMENWTCSWVLPWFNMKLNIKLSIPLLYWQFSSKFRTKVGKKDEISYSSRVIDLPTIKSFILTYKIVHFFQDLKKSKIRAGSCRYLLHVQTLVWTTHGFCRINTIAWPVEEGTHMHQSKVPR